MQDGLPTRLLVQNVQLNWTSGYHGKVPACQLVQNVKLVWSSRRRGARLDACGAKCAKIMNEVLKDCRPMKSERYFNFY